MKKNINILLKNWFYECAFKIKNIKGQNNTMAVIYRDGRDNSEKRGIGYKCPGQLLCASCLTSGSLNTAK